MWREDDEVTYLGIESFEGLFGGGVKGANVDAGWTMGMGAVVAGGGDPNG